MLKNKDSHHFNYALGFSFEYAGLGMQFSSKSNSDNFFLSFGYPGAAIGYQKTISTNFKHALTISAGRMSSVFSESINFYLLGYNYYGNSFSKSGLSYGLSVAYSNGFIDNQSFRPSFQIGYSF